ncbi:type II toxin-antitoxin system VapC family toxin [Catalinimonas sp. 4WD22]|uniref:type II toxin-antitoxin system VapC family toxin n=1 Tax=Catalinimonas locisalis TaxID=3133978 RepID=UPI003100ACDF
MNLFLDTSTLFKLYHEEEGTKEIDQFIESNDVDHFYVSEITKVEFTSAVFKKVRMNEITNEQAKGLIKLFAKDWKNFTVIEFNSELFDKAASLLEMHWERGLRTLDAIQLASALAVKKGYSCG